MGGYFGFHKICKRAILERLGGDSGLTKRYVHELQNKWLIRAKILEMEFRSFIESPIKLTPLMDDPCLLYQWLFDFFSYEFLVYSSSLRLKIWKAWHHTKKTQDLEITTGCLKTFNGMMTWTKLNYMNLCVPPSQCFPYVWLF